MRRNTVDGDRGAPEDAEKQLGVLGVEGLEVRVDEGWISAGGALLTASISS